MERFSVALCTYIKDNPIWLKDAIESLLNQTCLPSEIVIVADGELSAELEDVISIYENSSLFKIIRLPENQGHGKARNIAIQSCSNELVALMDADDISLPDRFEKQVLEFSQNENLDLVGGQIGEFIGDIDNIVGYRIVPSNDVEIKDYLRTRCPFNQVTVMFKKSSVERAGGYMDWFCNEDYYLWIRMFIAGMHFANINSELVRVRVGDEMYGRRGGWRYFKSEASLQVYMHKNGVTSFKTYIVNVLKRFVAQVLLTDSMRKFAYGKLLRGKTL